MAHSISNDLEMNDLHRPARDHHEDNNDDIDNPARPLLADDSSYTNTANKKDTFSLLCPAGITSLTVHTPDAIKGSSNDTKRQLSGIPSKSSSKPPRWNTKEFYCYYVIVIVYVVLMIRTAVRLSDGENCSTDF